VLQERDRRPTGHHTATRRVQGDLSHSPGLAAVGGVQWGGGEAVETQPPDAPGVTNASTTREPCTEEAR
jgi:hypothetical protein